LSGQVIWGINSNVVRPRFKVTLRVLARFWLLIGLALVCGCLSESSKTAVTPATSPSDSIEAEEYAVLSAVIHDLHLRGNVKLIVVLSQTMTRLDDVSTFAQKHKPGVSPEIVADYESKNREPRKLKPLFDLPVHYVFLREAEIDSIFERAHHRSSDPMPGSGAPVGEVADTPWSEWKWFYQLYPRSNGGLTPVL
jgi:hypothetical protein